MAYIYSSCRQLALGAVLLIFAAGTGAQSPTEGLEHYLQQVEAIKAKLARPTQPTPLAATQATTTSLASPSAKDDPSGDALAEVTARYNEIMQRYAPVEQAAIVAAHGALEGLKTIAVSPPAVAQEPAARVGPPAGKQAPGASRGADAPQTSRSIMGTSPNAAAPPSGVSPETLRRCAEQLTQVARELNRIAGNLEPPQGAVH